MFSLGVLFYAILEGDFITINGKAFYGAFKRAMGRVSLGYAVAMHGQGESAAFSSRAEGLKAMEEIALDVLKNDKNDRPSQSEIHESQAKVRFNTSSSILSLSLRTLSPSPVFCLNPLQ